jgi:hypothetical protein
LATSACSRTRSSGSAAEPCALPVFFMRRPCSERCAVSHKHALVSSRRSYPQKLCITMWTAALLHRKARCAPKACVTVSVFSPMMSRRAPASRAINRCRR